MVNATGGCSVDVIVQKEPEGVQTVVQLPMLALVVLSRRTGHPEDFPGNSHPPQARCDPLGLLLVGGRLRKRGWG